MIPGTGSERLQPRCAASNGVAVQGLTPHAARLIPTSGINGAEEQERRATSALLAVMTAVREFGVAMTKPFGAPSGPVEAYIEVPFETGGKRVFPDGLVRVCRGQTTWTALVEVKTGANPLGREQLEAYLDVAKAEGFDALITISNELAPMPGAHPTTQLSLELLLECDQGGALDVGCGSGVLAIAAAKLGFAPVVALDSDPAAVEATLRSLRERYRAVTASDYAELLITAWPHSPQALGLEQVAVRSSRLARAECVVERDLSATNKLAPAPAQPAAVQPETYVVYFDLDKSNVKPEAAQILDRAIADAKAGGTPSISVTGHADRSGAEDYNLGLSLRRADAVREYLIKGGVTAEQITVSGRGEAEPAVPTADGVKEPRNRRVEVIVQ